MHRHDDCQYLHDEVLYISSRLTPTLFMFSYACRSRYILYLVSLFFCQSVAHHIHLYCFHWRCVCNYTGYLFDHQTAQENVCIMCMLGWVCLWVCSEGISRSGSKMSQHVHESVCLFPIRGIDVPLKCPFGVPFPTPKGGPPINRELNVLSPSCQNVKSVMETSIYV